LTYFIFQNDLLTASQKNKNQTFQKKMRANKTLRLLVAAVIKKDVLIACFYTSK